MPKEIPEFKSDLEESEFWDSVDTCDYIDFDEPPVQIEFADPLWVTTYVKFELGSLQQLTHLAKRQGIDHRVLIRDWVCERLQEEAELEAQPKQAVG